MLLLRFSHPWDATTGRPALTRWWSVDSEHGVNYPTPTTRGHGPRSRLSRSLLSETFSARELLRTRAQSEVGSTLSLGKGIPWPRALRNGVAPAARDQGTTPSTSGTARRSRYSTQGPQDPVPGQGPAAGSASLSKDWLLQAPNHGRQQRTLSFGPSTAAGTKCAPASGSPECLVRRSTSASST